MILSNTVVRNINALGVLGLSVILGMGLIIQIALDELPCPLCLLQRVGFALVMFGFMLNVLRGLKFWHYGIVIIGALYGGMVSLRQIALHIVPGTGTYGSPILGLHFYTWAFLLFAASLLAVGVLLILSHSRSSEEPVVVNKIERLICWTAIGVLGLNVIATFLECGPFQCADNPVNYRLLSLLGG